jgi:hypothetical protein
LHSYVVARDYGFAPNPFFGFCTLATCKPLIRATAERGDWVVGTGSKSRGRDGYLVFAMRVTDTLTFDEYWNDPRFREKRPNLQGSKKQAFGDNIYHHSASPRRWRQEDSHHSLPDGSMNRRNVVHDTQTDRVLISDDFVYWGGDGPRIPKRLRSFRGIDLCGKRGHKNSFPDDMNTEFERWIRSTGEMGYCGVPLDWTRTP